MTRIKQQLKVAKISQKIFRPNFTTKVPPKYAKAGKNKTIMVSRLAKLYVKKVPDFAKKKKKNFDWKTLKIRFQKRPTGSLEFDKFNFSYLFSTFFSTQ